MRNLKSFRIWRMFGSRCDFRELRQGGFEMAAEAKAAAEDAKNDLFEDDDEFEEFEINEGAVRPIFPSDLNLKRCQMSKLFARLALFGFLIWSLRGKNCTFVSLGIRIWPLGHRSTF